MSSAALGQELREEHIYSQLNRLVLHGGLRPFVERHPEFSWTSRDPNGMLVTWAPSSASASGPEQPAPSFASADMDWFDVRAQEIFNAIDAPERLGSASA